MSASGDSLHGPLLLVVDSSGREGILALALGRAGGGEVLDEVRLGNGAFSAQLVPQIGASLSKHGLTKEDVGGFVVVVGPGSFTGLRVGLAAVKALAEVLLKPIAVVSLLEVIALSDGRTGPVVVAIDAGRQNIYVGKYEVEVSGALRVRESLLSREEFAQEVVGARLLTSDEGIGALARSAGAEVNMTAAPAIDVIAKVGYKKIIAGEIVSAERLEASYLSKPNAEIFSKPFV